VRLRYEKISAARYQPGYSAHLRPLAFNYGAYSTAVAYGKNRRGDKKTCGKHDRQLHLAVCQTTYGT